MELFNDIVQGDFIDNDNNQTIKTLMGFKWAATYCNQIKYVMKINENVIPNTYRLIKYLQHKLQKNPEFDNTIICRTHLKSMVIRDVHSKWYISKEEYPEAVYPPHCDGSAYILTGDLTWRFFLHSLLIKRMKFEDVFMGQLAAALRTPFINIKDSYDFYTYTNNTRDESPHEKMEGAGQYQDVDQLLFILVSNTNEFVRLWNMMLESFSFNLFGVSYGNK